MQYNLDLSQRWRDRRSVFVPPDSRINPSEFGVDEISRPAAAALISRIHYLSTCPVAMTCVGLFRKTGVAPASLEGVAVFGQPRSMDSLEKHAKVDRTQGIELTRFVLSDDCAFNSETWFMRRALGILHRHRPNIRVVLSHSDPFERTDSAGNVIFPGHVGQVYAASNAFYAGQGDPRTQYLCADGSALKDRNFSKIRREKQGWVKAMNRIIAAGAPPREAHETPAAWLKRALASPAFRPFKHPGVHVYLLPIDHAARKSIQHEVVRLPYPKRHQPEQSGRTTRDAA